MELVIPRFHIHLNSVYQIHTTPDGYIRSMPFDILDRQIRSDLTSYVTVYLNDPIITDMHIARNVLDDYLETYRQHLPQFHE